MSLTTVKQLHADLEKIASQNPGHLADAGVTSAYNVNLEIAKSEYPDDKILSVLPTADGNFRLGDILALVGQLKAVLEEHGGHPTVAHVGGSKAGDSISRKI